MNAIAYLKAIIVSMGMMSIMLRLTIVRARSEKATALSSGQSLATARSRGGPERLFLFFLTLGVVVFGYYLQAGVEALLQPLASRGEAVQRLRGASWLVPLLSAMGPGSVAGYGVACARPSSLRWVVVGIQTFGILSAFDLLRTIEGACSFRGFLVCLGYDLVGGPLAAVVVFSAHRIASRHGWFGACGVRLPTTG